MVKKSRGRSFDDMDLVGTDWSKGGSYDSFGYSGGKGGGKGGTYMVGGSGRCYEKHPPLPLKDGLVIYGGSCITPIVKDADVYIGLDHGMKQSDQGLPWTKGFEVYYPIQDMSVPKNPKRFRELVDWTIGRLKAGDKVHVGCIGGHGRTGMLLSAIVKVMLGEEDAIGYVRKHYCEKAVETSEQIAFLAKEFGIKTEAKPKKASYASGTGKSLTASKPGQREIPYVESRLSIW